MGDRDPPNPDWTDDYDDDNPAVVLWRWWKPHLDAYPDDLISGDIEEQFRAMAEHCNEEVDPGDLEPLSGTIRYPHPLGEGPFGEGGIVIHGDPTPPRFGCPACGEQLAAHDGSGVMMSTDTNGFRRVARATCGACGEESDHVTILPSLPD